MLGSARVDLKPSAETYIKKERLWGFLISRRAFMM